LSTTSAGLRAWRHARAASEHPWLERFLRFGFIVRGAVYLIVGSLALRLAMGRGGAALTQREAIERVAREPFGRALLVTVAVGLAGYALWGFVRAAFDPLERGRTPHGVARRLGYLSSGLGYGASFVVTVGMLAGISRGSAPIDWLARVLSWPGGPWLIALIGLGWVAGAGVSEIVKAVRGTFRADLRLAHMGAHEHALAAWLGGFGMAARGLVLGIVGASLVAAAWHADATRRLGMGGALLRLAHAPHGRYLLGVVALGLIAFGVYSILCAHWARTRPRGAQVAASEPPARWHHWWRRRLRAQEIVETSPGTLVVLNPSSGTNGENAERLAEITQQLRARGIEARGVVSESPRMTRKLARAAAAEGRSQLVVAGGDGTVRAAALELAGSTTALGLIPLGTMNNVARSLGIPLEVEGACACIAAGTRRRIDLGRMKLGRRWRSRRAREYAFVECAGVGLSAFAAFTGETIEKHRWWALPAALQRFFVAKRAAVHVELDGTVLAVETNIVTVLNSPLLGTHLLAAPEAKMDDGVLEVLVYEGWSNTEIARHFVAVSRGEPSQVPVHRARRVRIWSDRPMLTHLETNEGRESRLVEIEAVPGALTMIVGEGMALGS
jgi:diacylglycerol kinase family enzyme